MWNRYIHVHLQNNAHTPETATCGSSSVLPSYSVAYNWVAAFKVLYLGTSGEGRAHNTGLR